MLFREIEPGVEDRFRSKQSVDVNQIAADLVEVDILGRWCQNRGDIRRFMTV